MMFRLEEDGQNEKSVGEMGSRKVREARRSWEIQEMQNKMIRIEED
jgi:hypothetical protein